MSDPAEGPSSAGVGAKAPAPDALAGLPERREPPLFARTLRPHRSMSATAGAWCLGLAAAGLTLPLLPLLGTRAGWGLLPFLLAALLGLDWAFRRSHADARLSEELRLWPDLITVVRREARGGRVRHWHANPFWVELRLHHDAALEKYLTLRGNGREIELGAFLSPDEREVLHRDLTAALAKMRHPGSPQPEGC